MAIRFENDCLVLLEHLYRNPYTKLDDISAATCIPVEEVRRYLLADVWELRKYEKLPEWREKNPEMYAKVIESAKYIGAGLVKINTSKHDYFVLYSHKYGYTLDNCQEYPYISVSRTIPVHDPRIGDVEEARIPNSKRFSPLL